MRRNTRNLRKQAGIRSIDGTLAAPHVHVTERKVVDQPSGKGVVPINPAVPGTDLPTIREEKGVIANLTWQICHIGKDCVVVMQINREVVFLPKIVVKSKIEILLVIQPCTCDFGDGDRGKVVVQGTRESGGGEILQPVRRKRVLQPRICRANHVRGIPVTTHKLIAQDRCIGWPDWLVGIIVGVGPTGRGIVNRNQVSVCIPPIAEVPNTLLN